MLTENGNTKDDLKLPTGLLSYKSKCCSAPIVRNFASQAPIKGPE
nr:hypothetical protein Iba_chr14aCG16200 [Ipomoea batatas]